MRGRFMPLVPSQDRDRYIAILDEPAAVQSAAEPVAQTGWLAHLFRIGPMSGWFT
jgi:hypothetical protein